MLKIFGSVVLCVVGLVILLSLAFGAEWLGVEWKGFFDKKKANIAREVYKESESYKEGMVQDLARYYKQYNEAESLEDKESIAEVIRFTFSEYPADELPKKLGQFLENIRGY